MDTMTRTLDAVNTAFSGIDPRTGKPCHRASHTKARLSNSSRNGGLSPRMVRQSHALGLHVAAGILNPVSGVGRCSACNLLGTLAHGGDATLELAHDIPSAEGGAMCWCSLTLQHLACNRAMRDDVTLSSFAL
jgi:hypothetical protein